MKIKPNIGMLNALVRITIGLTLLSWTTAKLVKQPWRDSYLFVALCAAMKVAEGIVRYCPMTALFERYQDMMQQNQGSSSSSEDGADTTNISGDFDVDIPYNPT